MPDHTTPQAKRQKRQKRMHAIDLTNSPLLKMSPESSPVSHSISHSMPLKGSLQAPPIKWIPSFPENKATRTSVQ